MHRGYSGGVRLLLDLDNTLVDRDGAFTRWAEEFVSSMGGDRDDVDWLVAQDMGGYRARAELAVDIIDRFGCTQSPESLVSAMRDGVVTHTRCYGNVLSELRLLKNAGAALVIVTNGNTVQQKRKITASGLDTLIDAALISEEVGAKKPDRLIFESALRYGSGTAVPWMVGDHPIADMSGARAAGISTAWVSHSRPWSPTWTPDITETTPSEVLAAVRRARF
ncbi:HAD family hydrolase [Microbacterium trichothecenolyticum]|uniref:FMN phosphatase YigB (HAD superfamily) n=1 Tax=Microbacterium trichothecenolyticum TaxID=69370 RepID=A0ABU0U0T3_MICTR|nr:HAD family hydrolase [Microbacterium trichothecenolyticum]MDQ1124832.1 FMN phosphatase YigB (HAD superfamily) [Microbacterium trichothecenolyticum]